MNCISIPDKAVLLQPILNKLKMLDSGENSCLKFTYSKTLVNVYEAIKKKNKHSILV